MDYLQKVFQPFQDRSNQTTQITLLNKKKESKSHSNQQQVLLYLDQIYLSLQTQQSINMSYINPQYLQDIQKEFNQEGRAVMVDEIFRICKRFNSQKRTYHMSVYILDSFLSFRVMDLRQLPKLMDACYLISSKYEEIYPQPCRLYTNRFEIQELFQLEQQILEYLDYRLIGANTFIWFNYYWTILKEDRQDWLRCGLLLVDISLYCYQCLRYEPSKIACACLFSGMQMANIKLNWNQLAQQFNLHFMHDIKEISNLLGICLKQQAKHKRQVINDFGQENIIQ